jgi:hypothetical protein
MLRTQWAIATITPMGPNQPTAFELVATRGDHSRLMLVVRDPDVVRYLKESDVLYATFSREAPADV